MFDEDLRRWSSDVQLRYFSAFHSSAFPLVRVQRHCGCRMTGALAFQDPRDVSDLKTLVSRARAAYDGAVRLQASGSTLALWVCSMRPRLLGEGTPTVLGLRTVALGQPAELDRTVSLASMADRLARLGPDDTELPVPEVTQREAWASISPPREAWLPVSSIPAGELIDEAQRGIAEIAQILPSSPGALLVNNARATVWGRPSSLLPALPAGAAFAGVALGFWRPEDRIEVFNHGRWHRLSAPLGHVLIRSGASLDEA